MVDTVGSPEEAVRLAGLLEPSVVIVDASLPDGDGSHDGGVHSGGEPVDAGSFCWWR